jgi:hypothetical protein
VAPSYQEKKAALSQAWLFDGTFLNDCMSFDFFRQKAFNPFPKVASNFQSPLQPIDFLFFTAFPLLWD